MSRVLSGVLFHKIADTDLKLLADEKKVTVEKGLSARSKFWGVVRVGGQGWG